MRYAVTILLVLLTVTPVRADDFHFGDWVGQSVARFVDLVQSLSWSSSTYDFGSHDVGTTDTATFTITNSGNDTAEEVATSVTGAGFSLYSTVTFGNISASRTRVARVKFTPTGAGVFSGFASYSAPNIARVSVALSGAGVAVAGTDSTPNAFTFTDQTAVALSTLITSAPITVAGIDTTSAITVTGGTYDINGSGTFTASAGTVSNGNTVRAQHTSSGSNSTAVNTVVTIGGVSDTFSSTTLSGVTSYSDNFNRANGGIGTNWTAVTASNTPSVVSSTLAGATAGGTGRNAVYWNANSFTSDQCSTVQMAVLDPGNIGPMTRAQSSAETYYVATYQSTTSVRIKKAITGSYTTIQTDITGLPTIVAGDYLKVCATGSSPVTLEAFINGVSVGTRTDSTSVITGGAPGFFMYGLGARADNWTGENK